jgi:hypothetical protein
MSHTSPKIYNGGRNLDWSDDWYMSYIKQLDLSETL